DTVTAIRRSLEVLTVRMIVSIRPVLHCEESVLRSPIRGEALRNEVPAHTGSPPSQSTGTHSDLSHLLRGRAIALGRPPGKKEKLRAPQQHH
ncbi:hypothetical protein KUCAC02_026531, partial [Chaenocephalus aceratus]